MRSFAQVKVSIWNDEAFRGLTPTAQAMYFRLLTAPTLSLAGVADWRPNRIAAQARDFSAQRVRADADELVRAKFIAYDDDTEEVLVRTFIRHDGVLRSPTTAAGFEAAFAGVASPRLRRLIIVELAKLKRDDPSLKGWSKVPPELLADTPPDTPSDGVSDTPSGAPSDTPSSSLTYIHNQQPGPAETGTPSATPPGTAARIVDEWMSHCTQRPARKLIGQVRAEVQTLLDDDIGADAIRQGLARWQQKGKLGPSLLPSVVHEVGNQPPPPSPEAVRQQRLRELGDWRFA